MTLGFTIVSSPPFPLPAPLTQVHPALLIPPHSLRKPAHRALPYFDRHPLQPFHVDQSRERRCRSPLPLHRLLVAFPAEEESPLGWRQLLPPLGELLDMGGWNFPPFPPPRSAVPPRHGNAHHCPGPGPRHPHHPASRTLNKNSD